MAYPNKPGHRLGGRQKGTKNKVTASVKQNILAVFNRIGGLETMSSWANLNQTEFYKLYGKLLPLDVQSAGEKIVINLVKYQEEE